ncbi:hypothetical protein Q5H93_21810 [Hymenobacter sp. ASUV-10]|uniref:Tail fiber protein n=1 Tax=Hymenobacter aranciens TaxID=3063996 RepID=A0ABT9BLH3_9BACT|nr:hypothetical protein [Hymenobacter sp. ASUV-10]MDO7877393.1 hypothetical protein [Hymenobacter sp. ASUV-10]
MKKLEFDTGGRPLANDDLVVLQDEAAAVMFAPYTGRGAFIVSGCQVSGVAGAYTVAAGLLCLDGEFLRFYGASNVALPAQFQRGGFDFIDERPYETGGTKACIRERPAVLVAPNAGYMGGEFLPFTAQGGKRWKHVLQAATRTIGETQELVTASSYVPANYDATGVGLVGTEAWGWALCNGQGGRPDLRGRVTVGLDPGRADYDAIGDAGGVEMVTLLVSQIPQHTHPLVANVDTLGGPGQLVTRAGNAGASGDTPNSGPAGGGLAHENRMPFYTVVKRVWVGF